MSESVAAAITRLREKLIDLSARNPLLNFRHGAGTSGSQSVLRLVGKTPDFLFSRLHEQKYFYFEPVPEPTRAELDRFYHEPGNIPGLESEEARNRTRPDAPRWARHLGWEDVSHELPAEAAEGEEEGPQANRVRVLLFPDQLEARLRRLRANARLALQESGSNMLFLAFGFLEWQDRPAGARADTPFYQAPLILMPATIESDTTARGQRRLKIGWSGEDIQTNLSLRRKLSTDFAIELPELTEDERPERHFDRVRQAVSRQPAWKVRRFVTLALLTNLGKLLLYLDLDPEKWQGVGAPVDHPIVRALLGGDPPVPPDPVPFADEPATARAIDLDLCLVDRADASQAKALLAALGGQSMVVQGPPGTGKSQTITNLIAAALYEGKTVLFVAEKLAALEVVRRRLRELQLGDFCLELHSHKTRKKAFFEDIAARLGKPMPGTPAQFAAGLRELEARRRELDGYRTAIGREAGHTGQTVADLLFAAGRARAEMPELAETIDRLALAEQVGAAGDTLAIDRFAEERTVQAIDQVVAAARDLAAYGGPARCPWRGVGGQSLLALDPAAGRRRLEDWRDAAHRAAAALAQASAAAAVPLPAERAAFARLETVAQIADTLPALCALAQEAQAAGAALAGRFDLPFAAGVRGVLQAVRLVELAAAAPHEALSCRHAGLDDPGAAPALARLAALISARARLIGAMQGRIDKPEAEDGDEARLRAAGRLLSEASFFERFGGEWREARRLARTLSAPGASKRARNQGEALILLAERIARDREIAGDGAIRAACGPHFRGAATEVAKLAAAQEWRERVRAAFADRRDRALGARVLDLAPQDIADIAGQGSRALIAIRPHVEGLAGKDGEPWPALAASLGPGPLAPAFARLTTPQAVAALAGQVRAAFDAGKGWIAAQGEAIAALAIDEAAWFGMPEAEIAAGQAAARIGEALAAPEALAPWLAYQRARADAHVNGAGHVIAAVEAGAIAAGDAAPAWRIARLGDAARRLRAAEPILMRFDGLKLGGLRAEYARLDAEIMEMRRAIVAAKLMLRQPPEGVHSPRTKEMTELALLRRCIAMMARHPAIREVTARAGKALQALKPCFMMGPLSVAQYLAPGALAFDLVIMDEASQIRPEEAIGAAARGRQLVVVGDDRQLPPTSFFDRIGTDDGDGAEAEDEGGFAGQSDESILALAQSAFPGRQGMLQWHYRSRHPELIAFSNHQFYDDKLILFPAPQDSGGEIGLDLVFVEGGVAADGVNDREAQIVARAALDHLRERPGRSLMVVAMNVKQKERIETYIQQLATSIGCEALLDASQDDGHPEPFVVKNLENVQGDERDVVMISMTYGPRAAGGRVPQNFGPINQDKGHRRLNVLFSRAKERMVVYTAMRSGDVLAGPDSGSGVRALHDFLDFAETRRLPSLGRPTGRPPGSPFEEAVLRELDRAGYRCEPQLGVAGYYLDIAVRDPDAPQRFLLGVECDGASYHSTLSARDRDRLRQEVLESLGWQIERIWSVDWFRDPGRELRRILDRLASLRAPPRPAEGEAVAPEKEILAAPPAEAPPDAARPRPTRIRDEMR
jgi:very-short-patch-repair endonuclease